jgi:hypothetical protein
MSATGLIWRTENAGHGGVALCTYYQSALSAKVGCLLGCQLISIGTVAVVRSGAIVQVRDRARMSGVRVLMCIYMFSVKAGKY